MRSVATPALHWLRARAAREVAGEACEMYASGKIILTRSDLPECGDSCHLWHWCARTPASFRSSCELERVCSSFGAADCFLPISLQRVVDAAVRRAYTDPTNPRRASLVSDPLGRRINTQDNTPGGDALRTEVRRRVARSHLRPTHEARCREKGFGQVAPRPVTGSRLSLGVRCGSSLAESRAPAARRTCARTLE
jgi:hypothetical protein